MQERIGLIEDMHLKEMHAIEMRLRCVEEEKKKEIAEKEELKRERDQLLKELEGLKRYQESPYHGNDNSIFLFFSAVYGLFWLISQGNTNVILGDAYMMGNMRIAHWDIFPIESEG